MSRSIGKAALVVGSLLGLGLSGPVLVQGAAASEGAAEQRGQLLEEVVVTARRVEERVQDVPISITVFTQDRLDNLNVVNAVDLALVTPSLAANAWRSSSR